MTKSLLVCCGLLVVELGACDGLTSRDSGLASDGNVNVAGQVSPTSDTIGWGPKLLSLIPERGDASTPSLASVRAVFKDCAIGSRRALHDRCDLSANAPTSSAASSVLIEIKPFGSEARAIRLEACCSTDANFFHPIESQTVMRTELICPELTISSSEPVQAFRVASAGRRDFVYARSSRSTPEGHLVELTMLLSSIEQADECSTLAAVHLDSDDEKSGEPATII